MIYLILALVIVCLCLLVFVLVLLFKKTSVDYSKDILEIKNKQEAFISSSKTQIDSILKDSINRECKLSESLNKLFSDLFLKYEEMNKLINSNLENTKVYLSKFIEQFLTSFNDFNLKVLDTLNKNNLSFKESTSLFLTEEFKKFSNSNKDLLEFINNNLKEKMDLLIKTNKEKLDDIEGNVNKKLNDVLETSLKERFKSVFDNLNSVNTNITELKSVTGDITKVKALLSNVKTKGVIGEYQLYNIIQDILPSELYYREYQLEKNSQARVDFVVKILDNSGEEVLLPIDSKFITTDYNNYLEALESSDKDLIKKNKQLFLTKVKQKAKDIKEKYIKPPITTSYALMFLPSDYLYYEVVQDQETLEACRSYNIELVAPSTIIPMLNTIRLGFTSYKISRQSQKLFDAVLKFNDDFNKYIKVLDEAKKSADKTSEHLDKLSGIRTKNISKTIQNILEIKENNLLEDK